jgi:hypothetical protein
LVGCYSLGSMSILNKEKNWNTAIIIGSGNIVQDIIEDFIAKLQLKPSLATDLRLHFEKKYGEKWMITAAARNYNTCFSDSW